jgi:hypothetical protein
MIFCSVFKKIALSGLAVFYLMPNTAHSAPDHNQILFWIGTQDVIIKKRSLLPNIHEKLKPSNIKNLKRIKANQNNDILTMQETVKFTFIYFYEKDISCDASITYTWTRLKSNYELKSIIADCDV